MNFIEIPLLHAWSPMNLLCFCRIEVLKDTYGELPLNICTIERNTVSCFLSLSTVIIHQFHSYMMIITLIPFIPTLIPIITTLIPCIPIIPTTAPHIPHIPTLIPCIPTFIPCNPTLTPHIPTLIPCIPITPLIPFPNSPSRLLQTAQFFKLLFFFLF